MKEVFRKATVVFNYSYYSRLAASIVLVITISIGSLFVVNAEARNRFKNWIVTITDKSIVYSNDSKEIYNAGQYSIRLDDSENKYETSVLADLDFMKVISLDTDEQSIYLLIHTDNTQTELVVSDYKYQQAVVNGMPADFYEVLGGDGTNELFWYDEEYGLFFNLSGQLKLNDMIELAQRIRIIHTE